MPNRSKSNTSTWKGGFTEQSVNTPDFRKKKELGLLLPDNDYSWNRWDYFSTLTSTYMGLRSELDRAPGESLLGRLSQGYWTQVVGGARFGYGTTADGIHQILRNKLNRRLWDAPIDLGVALSEYRETANLVAGSMAKAAKWYKDIRKHPFATARRTLDQLKAGSNVPTAAKAAANAWLGYSYAVKPLMQDCYGAVKALTDGIGADIPVHVIRVSYKESLTASNDAVFSPMNRNTVAVKGDVKGSGRMIFYVDNPFTYTLDQLGVLNPLSLTWELIPFSFVVDWFLPIGNMLRGVRPPAGAKFAKAYTYVKAEVTWERSSVITTETPGWNTKGFGKLSNKTRKVMSQFPRFEYVRPDLSLSYNQLASGMSLLIQLL